MRKVERFDFAKLLWNEANDAILFDGKVKPLPTIMEESMEEFPMECRFVSQCYQTYSIYL